MRRTILWRKLMLFTRALFKPPKSIYRHLHFRGPFTISLTNNSFKLIHLGTTFENDIFWHGMQNAWEYQSVLLWEKLVQNSRTVLDIGANSGFYSLVSKAANPDSSVFAFEPISRNAQIFRENICLNNYDVNLEEIAVSNVNGIQIIYDIPEIPNNRQASFSDSNLSEIGTIPLKIKSIRLDDFVNSRKIEDIDLVKIDVEGHEAEVLEGFKENLQKHKPVILIEILNREIGDVVNRMLTEHGYHYFLNISEQKGAFEASELSPVHGRNFYCFLDKSQYKRLIKLPNEI